MASVNGVSSSNANSIYGNRNVISGLASGMDTESMIENAVSGIRAKISSLQQKETKLSWQQDAYRSITDKMVQFSRKYTSYTSATNLLSSSFFNKAVITATNGANKDKISATGKTTSDIKITSVDQLATASRYQVSGGGVLSSVKTDGNGKRFIESGEKLNLSKDVITSTLEGSLTLNFSNQTFMFNFKADKTFANVDEVKAEIEKKLGEQRVSFSDGTSKKASDVIKVEVDGGKIVFSDKTGGGNDVYISSATGKLNDTLGKPDFSGKDVSFIDLSGQDLTTTSKVGELLSGQTMSFTLDGVTKKITLPTQDELKNDTSTNIAEDKFIAQLNDKLNSAFGKGKVEAGVDATTGALRFTALTEGSNLIVSSDVNKTLGMKEQETTYLNTGKTLADLLGTNPNDPSDLTMLGGLKGTALTSPVDELTSMNDGTYRDKQGNICDADGHWVDADGKQLYGFELKINDVVVGTYTRDTSLETVMLDINNNIEAGVDVTYSKTTNQFVFAAKETGAGRGIKIGDDDNNNLAEKIFGEYKAGDVKAGQDAKVTAEINGSSLTLVRSSNNFDIDGLSITIKDEFDNTTEAVTFTTTSDADKIVSAVKSMVEDYNDMIKAIRDGFNTVPAQKLDKSRYEPLTEDQKADMTETAIKNYEEKAKQGILFADTDLSSLYSKLTSAISPSGADGAALRKIGITTDYSEGLTTLSIDETALRDALTTNPDSVRAAFTKVAGEGSNTNGLMQNLKKQLDTYSSTQGTKGVLINKAGSKYSATSLLDNSIKKQMETYEKQVDKWQGKLSDKVDYYTRQFTRLEQLISQMNSQGSSIMQMMGGG